MIEASTKADYQLKWPNFSSYYMVMISIMHLCTCPGLFGMHFLNEILFAVLPWFMLMSKACVMPPTFGSFNGHLAETLSRCLWNKDFH